MPKTDRTRLSIGRDGKYYKRADDRDWGRYFVLSDDELREEIRQSIDVKENMLTLSGQFKDGRVVKKPPRDGLKFIAPQMGTASKFRRIERKNWAKDIDATRHHNTTKNLQNNADSEYAQTISALVANSQPGEGDEDEDEKYVAPRNFDYSSGRQDNSRVDKVFHVIQKKYEQNLHVVDRLYDEKLSLEEYARSLELELYRTRKGNSSSKHVSSDQDYRLRESRTLDPPAYDELFDQGDDGYGNDGQEEMKRSSAPRRLQQQQQQQYAATVPIGEGNDDDHRVGRSRDLYPMSLTHSLRSHSAPRGGATANTNTKQTNLAQSIDGNRPRSTSNNGRARARSQSAGRGRSNEPRRFINGVSATLLADADRYVQRRRLLDEKERLQKLEQERYELELKERVLRASSAGRGLEGMLKRAEDAKRTNDTKLAAQRKRNLEQRRNERERLKEEKINKETLKIAALKGGLSWKELQELSAQQRNERIEKRKQELLMISALPRSIEESLSRSSSKKALLLAGAGPGDMAVAGKSFFLMR